MAEPVSENVIAPDFTLPDQDGKPVRLSAFQGQNVVLYFYPKDFTSGCTREACDFRDNHAGFAGLNAVVLGVSPDGDERHLKFRRDYELPFRLLSDPDHKVMQNYGAWGVKKQYGREYEGVIRSTFLIDREGKVVKVWRKVRVDGHVARVLKELEQLD